MRLTNLFVSGRAAYDEQQIALFDDVLIRLSKQVEIVARTRLSERFVAISEVATTNGQRHLQAIARRTIVSGPVRRILTERGNQTVLLTVIDRRTIL